jgi:hypothetical protein
MDYPSRRTAKGAKFSYVNEGYLVQIRANALGIIKPKNATEEALFNSFGLPLAKGGKSR